MKTAPQTLAQALDVIGRRVARENAEREIWPLLGFRLRDELANG